MNSTDWDDDAVIESWCQQQRAVAAEYLSRQPVHFGDLGDWPAWHVAPYVAVWAVESVKTAGKVGWWVISGDLPTDYASGDGVPDPRAAVAVFSERWAEAARGGPAFLDSFRGRDKWIPAVVKQPPRAAALGSI